MNSFDINFSFEILPQKCGFYSMLKYLNNKASQTFVSIPNKNNMSYTDMLKYSSLIKNRYNLKSIPVLSCSNLTKKNTLIFLEKMIETDLTNLLVVSGDQKITKEFLFADQLISFINQQYKKFKIFAPCYPESHPLSKNLNDDIYYIKMKIAFGVSKLITQTCYDYKLIYSFVESCYKHSINIPIIIGYMPIYSKKQIEFLQKFGKVTITKDILHLLDKYEESSLDLYNACVEYTIEEFHKLLPLGFNNIHIFTMNNLYVTKKIINDMCI
ncbi:methylenetetrahydrofolate reductase [Enterococcus hirae]